MHDSGLTWEKRQVPYDPRQLDSAMVTEDEHGRIVETADCGIRCPGCGICCQGYRDIVTVDYRGVEEFDLNLKAGIQPGRLVPLGENWLYRGVDCGPTCPGYEQCCLPFVLQRHADSVAEADAILQDREESTLSEIHEALLFLAHDGTNEAVAALEQYFPKAHTRVAGFAECALEEGRYFNTIPSTMEERVLMMKREVLRKHEDQVCEAQIEIDEELLPELERLAYELEIARRVKEKDTDQSTEIDWQVQIEVLEVLIGRQQGRLEELKAEIKRKELILAEIERDIGEGDTAAKVEDV